MDFPKVSNEFHNKLMESIETVILSNEYKIFPFGQHSKIALDV